MSTTTDNNWDDDDDNKNNNNNDKNTNFQFIVLINLIWSTSAGINV